MRDKESVIKGLNCLKRAETKELLITSSDCFRCPYHKGGTVRISVDEVAECSRCDIEQLMKDALDYIDPKPMRPGINKHMLDTIYNLFYCPECGAVLDYRDSSCDECGRVIDWDIFKEE